MPASVKIKKLMGKNGGWVGGSETILHEDGFFNFSKITDDPLATGCTKIGVNTGARVQQNHEQTFPKLFFLEK